jgi:hypothetical protein
MSPIGVLWVIICAVFAFLWITLGWFILPFFNLALFVGCLILMIPAFINNGPRY